MDTKIRNFYFFRTPVLSVECGRADCPIIETFRQPQFDLIVTQRHALDGATNVRISSIDGTADDFSALKTQLVRMCINCPREKRR